MYLLKILMVLVLLVTIDGYEDVYWMENGEICRRDYVPDICCIHYSNCAKNYGGLTKGHPELCYFSGVQKVFCCVENDEVNYDYSDYGKLPKKSEEEYSHQPYQPDYPQFPDYPHYSEPPQQQPIKKPPQYEPQQPITQQSAPSPPQQPNVIPSNQVATNPMSLCYGVAFGTPNTENRIGLECSKYITTSTQQPLATATNTTTTKIQPDAKQQFVYFGVNAAPLEFPHMAVLGYGPPWNISWYCGGSLISAKFVLTAAHCIQTMYGPVKFVYLGVHTLRSLTSSVQQFGVNNTYTHHDYNITTRYNDIALIELDNMTNITPLGVKPARLHNAIELPGEILIATGWGETQSEQYSNILQKVNLTYVSYSDCMRTYRPRKNLFPQGLIDSSQLCAGGGSSRGDTCGGDSGGPLQVKTGNDTYTIVGITSIGARQCGRVPAVYTRVSNYVSWIERILQQ